jgi:hypothetical protein
VARVPVLTPRSSSRFPGSAPGSAAYGAIVGAVRELAANPLPGVQDTASIIPPVAMAYVRRVAGANLWLWFTYDNAHVYLRAVTTPPPVPSD